MRKLLFMASLLLAATAASASPFLELSNLRVEAIDLNQDDALGANFNFEVERVGLEAVVLENGSFNYEQLVLGRDDSGTVKLVRPFGTAHASYDGNAARVSMEQTNGMFRNHAGMGGAFTVGAFTRLVFTVDYAGLGGYDLGYVAQNGFWHVNNSDWSFNEVLYLPGIADGAVQAGVFSFVFDNYSAENASGSAYVAIAQYAYPVTAPAVDVSEPASIGLLLAGLGGLVAVRRRRG